MECDTRLWIDTCIEGRHSANRPPVVVSYYSCIGFHSLSLSLPSLAPVIFVHTCNTDFSCSGLLGAAFLSFYLPVCPCVHTLLCSAKTTCYRGVSPHSKDGCVYSRFLSLPVYHSLCRRRPHLHAFVVLVSFVVFCSPCTCICHSIRGGRYTGRGSLRGREKGGERKGKGWVALPNNRFSSSLSLWLFLHARAHTHLLAPFWGGTRTLSRSFYFSGYL